MMNDANKPSALPVISTHAMNALLVQRLQERDVSFILIGGAAVAVHGCRDSTHFDEIDVLIEPTVENAERLINALAKVGVSFPHLPTDLAQPRKQVPVHNSNYNIDILTPRPDEVFADVLGRSIAAVLNDIRVKVIGRTDLILMKQVAAEHSDEYDKHMRDLECLVAV